MSVRLHPHAYERMIERGATEDEVKSTVENGEQFPVRFGRTGFRRNFLFDSEWRGRHYNTKKLEALCCSGRHRVAGNHYYYTIFLSIGKEAIL